MVWLSPERYELIKHSAVSPIAPEICIELQSPGNTLAQMMHKKDLFLAAGALEFWLCDDKVKLSFYDAKGIIEQSHIVPKIPNFIEID